jgi:hypothetical protein
MEGYRLEVDWKLYFRRTLEHFVDIKESRELVILATSH